MWKFKAERDDLKNKDQIEREKQHYIGEHIKLYEKCLTEAKKNHASDIYDGAEKLYGERAETVHIVGYYLYYYDDHALETWRENLKLAKGDNQIKTDTDREVTAVLERLSPDASSS